VSFESMEWLQWCSETPAIELQNLRNAFEEHRQIIAKKDAEIERLKDLLARAGKTLCREHCSNWTDSIKPWENECEDCKLIQELREAAK
jgi:hypothetical protein